jgi:hypothetical protein
LVGFNQLPKPHLLCKGRADAVEEYLVVFLHGLGLDRVQCSGFNCAAPTTHFNFLDHFSEDEFFLGKKFSSISA